MTAKSTTHSFGILYVVATPIGNLQDMTVRAVSILKTVDKIAAEDTRHSTHLLATYGISTPLISLHEHNEMARATELIAHLKAGQSIALISDAGTPLISDPGYVLVKHVRAEGIRVEPIPGACAAIAALSVSGLPTDRFIFEGFLSSKVASRKAHLERLTLEPRTLVFYEAPHRILESIKAMQAAWGGAREIVIARELTKLFETVYAGTIDQVIDWMKQDKNQQ
ncbi:MAG: 16S rRNA (cytidine(1402)-2'-O)-methyltransferase, partial [Rickettsiales bacterium]